MLSIVIPALNEQGAIAATIDAVATGLTEAGIIHEIIVVDDGSLDGTGDTARALGARVVRHPQAAGYGRSLKDGIRIARFELIGITDADGTYPTERLPELFRLVANDGFEMAVGARTGAEYRGNFLKWLARRGLRWLSQSVSGARIDDINSGLRVFRKELALRYLHTLSSGFSFTTGITLAALLNGHFVTYVPVSYHPRVGPSHVRYGRDSLRALQVILESLLCYRPLRVFFFLSSALAAAGVAAAVLALAAGGGTLCLLFGITSALCSTSAFVIFAIGLTAERLRLLSPQPYLPAGSLPVRFAERSPEASSQERADAGPEQPIG